VFAAVTSTVALQDEMKEVTNAIFEYKDLEKALQDVAGNRPIPHCAFMIYPGDKRRKLLDCLVKPISEWATNKVFSTLESRGAEAAYEFYQRMEASPSASAFRGLLWEHKVQRYFTTANLSSFTIRSMENNSTMEWAPFKNITTFTFAPANRIVGCLHECISAKKAGYFRPKSKNFASFDSIVYEPEKPLTTAVFITIGPDVFCLFMSCLALSEDLA
jgi:hypothetical protein